MAYAIWKFVSFININNYFYVFFSTMGFTNENFLLFPYLLNCSIFVYLFLFDLHNFELNYILFWFFLSLSLSQQQYENNKLIYFAQFLSTAQINKKHTHTHNWIQLLNVWITQPLRWNCAGYNQNKRFQVIAFVHGADWQLY